MLTKATLLCVASHWPWWPSDSICVAMPVRLGANQQTFQLRSGYHGPLRAVSTSTVECRFQCLWDRVAARSGSSQRPAPSQHDPIGHSGKGSKMAKLEHGLTVDTNFTPHCVRWLCGQSTDWSSSGLKGGTRGCSIWVASKRELTLLRLL